MAFTGTNWKYNVENLDVFFAFIKEVEKSAPQLRSELSFCKHLLESKNFDKTYAGNSKNLYAQIFHKTISEGDFRYEIAFNIEKAEDLIKAKQYQPVLADIRNADTSGLYVNPLKLLNVDLQQPPIFINFVPQNALYVIDGVHRLCVARNKGICVLPIYLLNPTDFISCIENKEIIDLYKIHSNLSAIVRAIAYKSPLSLCENGGHYDFYQMSSDKNAVELQIQKFNSNNLKR